MRKEELYVCDKAIMVGRVYPSHYNTICELLSDL